MKKFHKTIFMFFTFTSLSIASQLLYAEVQASAELAQLMGNIHTMQATFEQSLVNQHGSRFGTKTQGTMTLKRPGKFRWEITQPHNQLIILNEDQMLSYDSDLAQLTKRKVNVNRPGNPAMLLSSPVQTLQQAFQIVKLKNPKQEELWFKLTPKNRKGEDNGYQWIKIIFAQKKLNAIYIFDSLEQTSLISFNNIISNAEISDKTFTFTPPSGTEIFNAK